MEKNLIKFIVEHGTLNKDNLLAILNGIDPEKAERFASVLFGITDFPTLPNKVKSKYLDYSACDLVSYDILENRVNYRAKVKTVRYFKTQEDADVAIRYGRYWEGERKESDEYKVSASFVYDTGNFMSLEDWLSSEVVEK